MNRAVWIETDRLAKSRWVVTESGWVLGRITIEDMDKAKPGDWFDTLKYLYPIQSIGKNFVVCVNEPKTRPEVFGE